MTDPTNFLAQVSTELAARVAISKNAIVAIRLASGSHITGTLWQSDILVASEQSLPKRDEFEVLGPDGAVLSAKIAGRDSGTNISILKLAKTFSSTARIPGDVQAGAIAIAIGADGGGGASARLGIVNVVGPEWHSSRGGHIDRRILLDINLARSEEGGPVFDTLGGVLGISTFGPRGQVLVIPTATIERIVPILLRDGYIARGWLGVALQPVAVPDALRGETGQARALMVMSTTEDGPATKAGIVAGDIILTVDGTSTRRFRSIAKHFGTDSIGRKSNLRLIRSGKVISMQAIIAKRPDA